MEMEWNGFGMERLFIGLDTFYAKQNQKSGKNVFEKLYETSGFKLKHPKQNEVTSIPSEFGKIYEQNYFLF